MEKSMAEISMVELILKKREGDALTGSEIRSFVQGYTRGEIPDYQASALLMAIFFQGMDQEEIRHLTGAMKESGDIVDLSAIRGVKVDKHSTGGVGDKTTLIAGPLAAACGVPVAKMSGRGLGFTGGTVDKLEAIPGFRTALKEEEFIALVNEVGLAVIGQTGRIAPADKKLYALRDVTGTVDSLSLITSSIMSKKLASGSDAIVLDVKCGDGAFMERLEDARALARGMVELGEADGKRTVAVITDMNQPLGFAVGNANEVVEAIETLKGRGPVDITRLSLILAGMMVYVSGLAATEEEGLRKAEQALYSGEALGKLARFIEGQGGDPAVTESYELFPRPKHRLSVLAPESGFLTAIGAKAIGLASQRAGAGREKKEDSIDLSAGILLRKKVGEPVARGEELAEVSGSDFRRVQQAAEAAAGAFAIGSEAPAARPLVLEVLDGCGAKNKKI